MAYPGKVGSEITPVQFDVIETMVSDIFGFAVKHVNVLPGTSEEIAARRASVLSQVKVGYEDAWNIYQFEFAEDSGALEWEFTFLFQGQNQSWIIHAECVWQ